MHQEGKSWTSQLIDKVGGGVGERREFSWGGLPYFTIGESGRYYLTLTHQLNLFTSDEEKNAGSLFVMYSDDQGQSWSDLVLVNKSGGNNANESRIWENSEGLHVIWVEGSLTGQESLGLMVSRGGAIKRWFWEKIGLLELGFAVRKMENQLSLWEVFLGLI